MRFEQQIHWSDGQFLQPHHFQYMQRVIAEYVRFNRLFSLPYAYGLIDFEPDIEALDAGRVEIRRFSAVMPDGLEVSAPGNCILKPLDLSEALKKYPHTLTIYVAAPLWSELESNVADEAMPQEKKIFLPQKKSVRDENTGDNEVILITRRINARFVTDMDDLRDMQLLPVLKLNVNRRSETHVSVKMDEHFIPPFMILKPDNPLFNSVTGLLKDVRRCRNKLQQTFTEMKSDQKDPSGLDPWNITAQLRILNCYDTRLNMLMGSGCLSPFDLYLEFASFLSELISLKPIHGIEEIRKYNHDNYAPQFTEIFNDIRSFIMEEGGTEYVKFDFSSIEGGNYLFTPLKTADVIKMEELYLAVHSAAAGNDVIRALEQGDTFKLINPSHKTMRVRGLKLTNIRYPPRFLPVLSETLWFKPELEESLQLWQEICKEKGIIIDYAHEMFPDIKVTLFMTVK
jgi:type VI secretion system ImpJ/VasE family protein